VKCAGFLDFGLLCVPAPQVKAPIICCICSGVRLGSGGTSFPLVSGLGLDVDALVFLRVGNASVSSKSDPSSELSVVELTTPEY